MKNKTIQIGSKVDLHEYMVSIGSKGGKKSKRVLTPAQARAMVKLREEKRRDKNERS
jgi:hypothetical protein